MNPTYLDNLDEDYRNLLMRHYLFEEMPRNRIDATKMIQHYSAFEI